MRPTTVYGVTKVYTELLGEYYHQRYGVDFRSLRYPGIISSDALPGGGTTDYAVAIYYEALKRQKYECYLDPKQRLPMMYMPDCIKATIRLLTAPEEFLNTRCYNVAAVSFTPEEQAESLKKFIPDFEISYNVDERNQIAETWPNSLDDSIARIEWDWEHDFDLDAMTEHMLHNLKSKMMAGHLQ
eukprot:TRINITY_DN3878_c0_g1_i6.p1 TRINITY_DN3878_c0_g1~~TRINITY_DN3878_c0_g1_i6.p1  ORF type:complete len:185 (+),score=44.36 TRINITY_DN3878_c0_g1_i6:133-687(+)